MIKSKMCPRVRAAAVFCMQKYPPCRFLVDMALSKSIIRVLKGGQDKLKVESFVLQVAP